MTAVCGDIVKDATEKNELCAACSRLFKYLIADYIEEYSASLRDFVSRVEVRQADVVEGVEEGNLETKRMQELAFAVTAIHIIIRFGVYQTYPSQSA